MKTYTEEFKKTIVELYENGNKNKSELAREYILEHAKDWYECNKMLKEECPKYGIKYIDTSKNREKILEEILNEIAKKS